MQVADKVQKQDTAFVAAYPHFNVNGTHNIYLLRTNHEDIS